MTKAAGSATGPGGFSFDAVQRLKASDLGAALQLGHDQGINGGTVDEHLAHSLGFVAAVAAVDATVEQLVDLGTGGGYPGLVLAYLLPDTAITLVEVREKRADYLRRAVYSLGLAQRTRVFVGEASALAQTERDSADVVTARSFATPAITAECAAPLLRRTGSLIVSEPPGVSLDERWPEDELTALGLAPAQEFSGENTRLAVVKKVGPTPDRYPRRRRQMERAPLF